MSSNANEPVTSERRMVVGGLDDARVIALLERHLARARSETAIGSAHALDLDGLGAPDMTFWSLWEEDEPLAVGALRRFPDGTGEIKSMFTVESARRRGIGGEMLGQILSEARLMGLSQLYLETGSWPYFAGARALYASHGFTERGPFRDYRPDPNSVFMERAL